MSNTTTPIRCYPHHHMTAQQYGFWDVCRALAYQNNVLYFNGRSIAERFQGMSKSTAYLLADALVEGGWFKLLKDSTRRRDGTFSPKQYRVLSHEQWAQEHPDGCTPVQPAGLDDEISPVQPAGMDTSPVQPADSPVQPADQPVQPAGHNLLINLPTQKQPTKEPDNHRPFQPAGLDGFMEKFEKKKRGQPRAAAQPILKGGPVQSAGQVESDISKADAADRVAVMITHTIGAFSGPDRAAWAASVRQLLDKGHSMNEIQEVADFAHRSFKSGTMKYEGGPGFVKNYGWIRDAYMARQVQEGQKGLVQ